MALDTVTDYVREARILLQDVVETYRYPNADLISALNLAIMTARRNRPDLFMEVVTIPQFVVADIADGTAFAMDVQYRVHSCFSWLALRSCATRRTRRTRERRRLSASSPSNC